MIKLNRAYLIGTDEIEVTLNDHRVFVGSPGAALEFEGVLAEALNLSEPYGNEFGAYERLVLA